MFNTLKSHLFILGLMVTLPALVLIYILAERFHNEVASGAQIDATHLVSQLAAQQGALIESAHQILITTVQVPEHPRG